MQVTTPKMSLPWSLATLLQLCGLSVLGYTIAIVVYRRYFHPLAKIPGPFLPAVTMLYQTYYNGLYYREVARMHDKYGPIVRVTPDEIHLSDPENFEKIYFIGSPYEKSANYYNAFCMPYASFTTPSNAVHKSRRVALNPMFGRRMVLYLESTVQSKVHKLCRLTQSAINRKQPMDLHHGFRCVSVDVVTEYAYAKSYDLLERPDLGAQFFKMIRGVGPVFWAFQLLSPFQPLALHVPPWLAQCLSRSLGLVSSLQEECLRQLDELKQRMTNGKGINRPTIFSTILSPEDKPAGYYVPSSIEAKDEAYSVLAAAADNTGNTMTVAAYHILSNKRVYAALVRELVNAFPEPDAELPFVQLEKLPYLTAVIKEALRLTFPVPGRLPRVTPPGGATFNGYFVPEGTVVSMSSWVMHRNEELFPNAMEFRPERWLDGGESKHASRYIMSFGADSRNCIGQTLAYSELYITLGTIFRRFRKLKVWKTTDYDMEFEDFFAAYYIEGRNWLKAVAD